MLCRLEDILSLSPYHGGLLEKRKKLPASSRPRTAPPFGEVRRAKQNKTKKSATRGALGVRRSKSSASLFPWFFLTCATEFAEEGDCSYLRQQTLISVAGRASLRLRGDLRRIGTGLLVAVASYHVFLHTIHETKVGATFKHVHINRGIQCKDFVKVNCKFCCIPCLVLLSPVVKPARIKLRIHQRSFGLIFSQEGKRNCRINSCK